MLWGRPSAIDPSCTRACVRPCVPWSGSPGVAIADSSQEYCSTQRACPRAGPRHTWARPPTLAAQVEARKRGSTAAARKEPRRLGAGGRRSGRASPGTPAGRRALRWGGCSGAGHGGSCHPASRAGTFPDGGCSGTERGRGAELPPGVGVGGAAVLVAKTHSQGKLTPGTTGDDGARRRTDSAPDEAGPLGQGQGPRCWPQVGGHQEPPLRAL